MSKFIYLDYTLINVSVNGQQHPDSEPSGAGSGFRWASPLYPLRAHRGFSWVLHPTDRGILFSHKKVKIVSLTLKGTKMVPVYL